jgi:hypothetical protein
LGYILHEIGCAKVRIIESFGISKSKKYELLTAELTNGFNVIGIISMFRALI